MFWKETVEKIFGAGTNLAKKPCPRSAYLGLCEDGLVAGVPKGIYIREQGGKKRNKSYAIHAIHMLFKNPSLANDAPRKLWNKVLKDMEENPYKSYDAQMHVVLALWRKGMITKSA